MSFRDWIGLHHVDVSGTGLPFTGFDERVSYKHGILVAQVSSGSEENGVFSFNRIIPHIEQEKVAASVKGKRERVRHVFQNMITQKVLSQF